MQAEQGIVDAMVAALKHPGALVKMTLDRSADLQRVPKLLIDVLRRAEMLDEEKTKAGLRKLNQPWPVTLELTNGSGIQIVPADKVHRATEYRGPAPLIGEILWDR